MHTVMQRKTDAGDRFAVGHYADYRYSDREGSSDFIELERFKQSTHAYIFASFLNGGTQIDVAEFLKKYAI